MAVLLPSGVLREQIEAAARSRYELVTREEAEVVLIEWEDDEQVVRLGQELPGTAVVALLPPSTTVGEALRAGARAALTLDASPVQVLAAIEAVHAGLVVFEAADPEEISIQARKPQRIEALTPREQEVLGLMAEGYGNKEIAWRMSISEHTVKFHVASVMAKLGAGTRTEAVTAGIRSGWVFV